MGVYGSLRRAVHDRVCFIKNLCRFSLICQKTASPLFGKRRSVDDGAAFYGKPTNIFWRVGTYLGKRYLVLGLFDDFASFGRFQLGDAVVSMGKRACQAPLFSL